MLTQMLNQAVQLDRVLRALADPTRRTIVERLSRGPASVTSVAEPLRMSLSAVLQHLRVLETSGVVRSEKVGRVRVCRMEPAALKVVERWIQQRRHICERNRGDEGHPS